MNVLILMKRSLLLLSLCTCFTVFAQESEYDDPADNAGVVVNKVEESECPKPMVGFCLMVSGRMKDKTGKNKYFYQSKMAEASCIDTEKDSPETQRQKIQNAWANSEENLKCTSTGFDVSDGHIVKYAVAEKFDDFINDVAKWKINLNKIDKSDGRTVLDYIQHQIDSSKGNPLEEKYQNYYNRLKAAGAKHKSEL